ncbi:MAG: protein TolR [Thermodesulfobacteriota bacterium]
MDYNPLDKGLLAEINVTPFVDVMLVLLIIFMVTAPMLEQGVEVNLPQTKTVQTLPEDSDHVVLSIKKDGTIYLDEYKVEPGKLRDHLKKIAGRKGELLYLRADSQVEYGRVVDIMSRVKDAGIERLGVVAEKEGD